MGLGAGACPVGRRRDDRGIYGGERDLRLCDWRVSDADQNERDYRGFVTAVKEGRTEAIADV
jgi:hypothetical protein